MTILKCHERCSQIDEVYEELTEQICLPNRLFRPVVPNHWATDRYWSMSLLVPGRREIIHTLFCYILKVVLFWKMDSLTNISLFLLSRLTHTCFSHGILQKISPQANVFRELLCKEKRKGPSNETVQLGDGQLPVTFVSYYETTRQRGERSKWEEMKWYLFWLFVFVLVLTEAQMKYWNPAAEWA